MTRRAGVDFFGRIAQSTAPRIAARRIDWPAHASTLIKHDGEPFGRRLGRRRAWRTRPIEVRRCRTVTGLATHRYLGESRVERVARGVITLAHLGGVAIGAHEVPVLRALRPVQLVTMVDALIGVLPEPALAAPLLGSRIPGQGQRLQAPARQLDKVLLHRIDTEGVLHLEVRQPSVGPVGAHDECAAALQERRGDAVLRIGHTRKVTEHVGGCGVLHGLGMVGLLPGCVFGLMTVRAAFAADETGRPNGSRHGRRLGRRRRSKRCKRTQPQQRGRCADQQQQADPEHPLPQKLQ